MPLIAMQVAPPPGSLAHREFLRDDLWTVLGRQQTALGAQSQGMIPLRFRLTWRALHYDRTGRNLLEPPPLGVGKLECLHHKLLPNRGAKTTPGGMKHRAIVIVAHPDTANQVRGEAHEPDILAT
jgi:hypothetical protein